MHARRRVTGLVILLLLFTTLSGCTGPTAGDAGEQVASATPVTAMQAVAHAGNWTQKHWRGDAELVLASGIEAAAEQALGDGRTTPWQFLFWSPSGNATQAVTVTGDGVEVRGQPGGEPTQPPEPVNGWQLDSPQAVQAARENRTFAKVLDAPDGEVAMTLGMAEGAPVWELYGRSHKEGVSVQVTVSAATGELR